MLYLCATPIGNLEDITLRVLRALKEADAIWAEDTRHTLHLLNHYAIKKPLVSYHAHNMHTREEQLVQALRAGRVIAYCSDAGMPGISDPGAQLVSVCARNDLPVTVLPGASAVLTAAVLCGLDCDTFTFFGFLPRDKKQRRNILEKMRACPTLMLLYESPVRVPATLRELSELLGHDRKAAVLRELTKLHEQTVRGTLETLSASFCDPPRGECVIAVEGKPEEEQRLDTQELDAALKRLIESGLTPRDAATAASALMNVSKNVAYQRTLLV